MGPSTFISGYDIALHTDAYMPLYLHVYTYINIYTCLNISIYVYVSVYLQTHIPITLQTSKSFNNCLSTRMCIYTAMPTPMHIYIHTCTSTVRTIPTITCVYNLLIKTYYCIYFMYISACLYERMMLELPRPIRNSFRAYTQLDVSWDPQEYKITPQQPFHIKCLNIFHESPNVCYMLLLLYIQRAVQQSM